MKLSSVTSTSSTETALLNTYSINQERSHLLCLNQQEALMLFGLMQAALRHEPTRLTVLSRGEYKHFHRQLSQALAESISLPQNQS